MCGGSARTTAKLVHVKRWFQRWHKPISYYAFENLGNGGEKRDWTEIVLDGGGWVDLRNWDYISRLPNRWNKSFSDRRIKNGCKWLAQE